MRAPAAWYRRVRPSVTAPRPRSDLASGRRPRLLLVATLAEVGGVATYLGSLLPAVAARFDVMVAAHGNGPLVVAAAENGVRYVPLRHVRRSIHPLREPLGLLELYRLCRRFRPDIIHVNSSKAGILGRVAAALAGVPVRIFSVHGWGFRTNRPALLYLVLERLVRLVTTLTICVSEAERKLGVEKRTCDAPRTIVIPNGVHVPEAASAHRRAGVPTIVSVGRLKAPKDFRTLVEALSRVTSSFRAIIVGDGPDRESIEELVDATGLRSRLELLGERGDVPELLSRADVFVLSSLSEAMPMSILEAMAAGLPVVASDVGGVPEVVLDERTGLLVPPAEPAALASAITRMLENRELRLACGAHGLDRARKAFSLERFRTDHVNAYRVLLDTRALPVWS